jgi:quinol monooxygenase YgiN
MAVKILIYRSISKDQEAVVRPLLKQLHEQAFKCKGYISGESLISSDSLEEQLIISSWESLEYWEAHLENEEAKDLRYQVEQVLGRKSVYKIYYLR